MRYKKIIALPVLLLAMSDLASAGVYPSFNPNLGAVNTSAGPNTLDYTFDQTGLNGSFTNSGTGWTLNVTGSGPSAFYVPGVSNVYTVTAPVSGPNYQLTASFDSTGHFQTGKLDIYGTVSGTPAGSVPQAAGQELFGANLYAFGYNASQATVGFLTQFDKTTWGGQNLFTGLSGGDVVYLFNQGGVATGFGPLSQLISEFTTGHFSNTSFVNVESLAAVPLPLPAVLFGTGLTALMGFARQRRNHPKSI
jgi:hypothetical protein